MSHPVARAVEYAKRVSITSPLSVDTPLYKFMPIGRLPQLARDGQLVLVRPEVWDDPQEPLSTVMKIQAIGHTGQYRSEIVQEYPFQAFAMSWTKAEMRDTMLRAYSTLRDLPEQSEDNVPAFDLRLDRGEGVHISTTVGQLNSASGTSAPRTSSKAPRSSPATSMAATRPAGSTPSWAAPPPPSSTARTTATSPA